MSSSFLLAIRQTHPLRLRATLDVSCLQATLAIAAATSLRDSTCAVSWPLWMNPAFGRLHISLAFGRLYMSLAFGRLWMRFWHCHSRLALFQLLPYQTELIYISSGTFQLTPTSTHPQLTVIVSYSDQRAPQLAISTPLSTQDEFGDLITEAGAGP